MNQKGGIVRLMMRHLQSAVTRLRQNNGFSIAGVLAGMMLLSVVVSGAGYLLASTKAVELQSSRTTDIDRAHLATLQKARNLKFLKTSLGLANPNNPLAMCLGYYGSGCQTYSNNFAVVPGSTASTDCEGACSVTSTISYRATCTDTSCTHLTILAVTSINSGVADELFKTRESEFAVPGIFLVDKYEINFRCARQTNMNGINLGTFSAECATNANTGCAGMPMENFNPFDVNDPARCKAVVQQTCPAGTVLRDAGLLPGQTTCAPI